MAAIKDSDYKCTLNDEILEKAKKELNEDPNTRLIEVKTLRERLEKIPGLVLCPKVTFLLGFLRARKFDQERAYQLVKYYYEARRDIPDIYADMKPCRARIVLNDGMYDMLEDKNNEGCAVFVIRPPVWDLDRHTTTEILQAMYLSLLKMLQNNAIKSLALTLKKVCDINCVSRKSAVEGVLQNLPALIVILQKILDGEIANCTPKQLAEDEETQINGIHIIVNLHGMSWRQASHITPNFAKNIWRPLQESLPLRVNRFDFVNEPTFFDIMFAVMKPFIKEKMSKRVFLNGSKLESLHAVMNPEYLPTDLGGKKSMYSNKAWIEALLDSDGQFEEDNKFGFVKMSLNTSDNISKSGDSGLQGLGGTFKKLDI